MYPYDGQVVRTPGADGLVINRWDADRMTEKWIFSEQPIARGFGWNPNSKVKFNHAFVSLESKINNLAPGDSFTTEPLVLSLDTFRLWKQFRRYMGHSTELSAKDIAQSLDCKINEHNPFMDDSFQVSFEEIKKIPLEGKTTITSKNNLFQPIEQELKFENNKPSLMGAMNKKQNLILWK